MHALYFSSDSGRPTMFGALGTMLTSFFSLSLITIMQNPARPLIALSFPASFFDHVSYRNGCMRNKEFVQVFHRVHLHSFSWRLRLPSFSTTACYLVVAAVQMPVSDNSVCIPIFLQPSNFHDDLYPSPSWRHQEVALFWLFFGGQPEYLCSVHQTPGILHHGSHIMVRTHQGTFQDPQRRQWWNEVLISFGIPGHWNLCLCNKSCHQSQDWWRVQYFEGVTDEGLLTLPLGMHGAYPLYKCLWWQEALGARWWPWATSDLRSCYNRRLWDLYQLTSRAFWLAQMWLTSSTCTTNQTRLWQDPATWLPLSATSLPRTSLLMTLLLDIMTYLKSTMFTAETPATSLPPMHPWVTRFATSTRGSVPMLASVRDAVPSI